MEESYVEEEEEEEKEDSVQEEEEQEEEEEEYEEEEGSYEEEEDSTSPTAEGLQQQKRTIGASLLTPPVMRTRKRGEMSSSRGRSYPQKTTTLFEATKGREKARMEKERQKEKFKEAGWVRVENVQKYEWTFYHVPPELQLMTLELPNRFV